MSMCLNTDHRIDQEEIHWCDINELEDCVFGSPYFSQRHDFNKYPDTVIKEFKERGYYSFVTREFDFHSLSTTGCRIRFRIPEDEFFIRAELKGDWEYVKILYTCSAGIDVYQIDEFGTYVHIGVYCPRIGENHFTAKVKCRPDLSIVMFLPCYNTLSSMQIGVKGFVISADSYPNETKLIFYGHSVTQGASASRSGNIYVNIISRYCDSDVVNYAMSSCCKGLLSVAEEIAIQNTGAIVVDAFILDDLRYELKNEDLVQLYFEFYRIIRKRQNEVPLILITRPNYTRNKITNLNENNSMKKFYESSEQQDANLYLIDLNQLFDVTELDLIAVDEQHLTDYGMVKVANEIYRILHNYGY